MNPPLQPQTGRPADQIEMDVVSICGPVREENQDAAAAWQGEVGEAVLLVVDGMGGHAAGREAAEIVVRVAVEVLQRPGGGSLAWEDRLRQAFAAAQEAVRATAARGGAEGMGATAVMAVLAGEPGQPTLHLAHAGDSRAYLLRGRAFTRLTADHSLVGQLVRDGLLAEEEAFGHPDSNVIQRAIGQSGPLEPEVQAPLALASGDLILLSSDGLHGVLPDDEIAQIVVLAASSGSTAEICQRLLDAALAAHSADNITVGCLRVTCTEGAGRGRRITRVEAFPTGGGETFQGDTL
jgi:protein phosphatase